MARASAPEPKTTCPEVLPHTAAQGPGRQLSVSMMRKPRTVFPAAQPLGRRDLVLLLCGAALFVMLFHDAAPRIRFQYDEADYMVAARMGLLENYRETSSLSLPGYLRTGLKAVSGGIDRTDLSEYARQRGDVSFFRHYHGPLYFYWLTLVSRLTSQESQVRAAGLAFHLLAFVTVFAGMLWVLGPEGRPAAWIASLAYLFSVNNIRTSLGVSTHQMYAWLALMVLFVISRFLITARTKHLLGAIGGATIALCTLEYGALLFLVLSFSTWLRRRYLLSRNPSLGSRRVLVKGIGLFLGICAVLWPAGLFKLSMLKGYLVVAYLALTQKDSFGSANLIELWSNRLSSSPLEYAILFVCLAAGLHALTRFRSSPEPAPFVIYAGLILLITLKSDFDRYLSSAPPALYVVGGIVLAGRVKRLPGRFSIIAGVVGFLLLLNAMRAVPAQAAPHLPTEDDAVSFVSRQRDRLRSLLVPWSCVPTIHYYIPEIEVRSYRPEAGMEHLIRRLAVAPVDALLVYRAADSRLGPAVAKQFGEERMVGPEPPDSSCGSFVIYFRDRTREGPFRWSSP